MERLLSSRNKVLHLSFIFFAFLFLVPEIAFARIPNDPSVKQWGYNDIGLYDAWDKVTGSSDVVVAVIDNGFDTFHPDLKGNVWVNKDEIPDNRIDDDANGYVDDVWGWNFAPEDLDGDGKVTPAETAGNNNPRPRADLLNDEQRKAGTIHHGTLVAGIIGAVGNNSLHGSGVNWNVKLMNIKVLGNEGNGDLGRLGEAVRYAVDNGADIINFSVVGSEFTPDFREAVEYAYAKGVAMVAAAGNNSQFLNAAPFYPVCADKFLNQQENKVLGVSAMDIPHTIARFSNTGSECIDITAPGVGISSTMRFDPRYGLDQEFGGGWNGTSFASPMVSAALALVKSIQPTWKAPELYEAVLSTVHKTPPQDEAVYANFFGRGLLQIQKAVDYALEKKVAQTGNVKLGFIDGESGTIREYDAQTQEARSHVKQVLIGARVVRPFTHNGLQLYAIATPLNDTTLEIRIVDANWTIQTAWRIPFTGDVAMTAADVHDATGTEIILTSGTSDGLFVYSAEGTLHQTISLPTDHGPVALASISNENGKEDILAVYKNNLALTLHRYTGTGRLTRFIPLRNIKDRAVMEVGDVTGDGKDNIVLAGGEGEEPVLMYLADDGTQLQANFAYEPGMRSGLELVVQDYNADGVANAIVIPRTGLDRARVWQGTSIIAQPDFAQAEAGHLILLF